MSDLDSRLDRIEQLLIESNRLRQQAIDLQNVSLERQASLIDEQRRHLDKAAQINEGTLALQARARRIQIWVVPVMVLLFIALICLQFFR